MQCCDAFQVFADQVFTRVGRLDIGKNNKNPDNV